MKNTIRPFAEEVLILPGFPAACLNLSHFINEINF
jgi:hypothetical protein